ncbi:MlaD family protein [Uliginosibacterium sp. sgz301328]|uniref:MlaD family protein n=1 Tax=Uliginosibacterium sp. sgz301328 TaxID=3243764 RepID=UPI00359CF3F4
MENRAHALVVGLFAVLLCAALAVTLWWFAGSGEEFKHYELVSTHTVTGLNPQAAVRYRGVRVGRVMDVELDENDPQRVIVTIRVRSDIPITRDTRATLNAQGITGTSYVLLDDDGKDPRPIEAAAGQLPRIPLSPGLLDQASSAGRDIIARLQDASIRLEKLLSEKNLNNIDATLNNVAQATAHLNDTLAQAPQLVADLRRFTSQQNAEQLSSAITDLRRASAQIGPAIDNWNQTLGRVRAAGDRIDRLGGDLQTSLTGETLPRVNELVSELQTTASQLNRVLDDMSRSPQMLLTGRQAIVPGPGETNQGPVQR